MASSWTGFQSSQPISLKYSMSLNYYSWSLEPFLTYHCSWLFGLQELGDNIIDYCLFLATVHTLDPSEASWGCARQEVQQICGACTGCIWWDILSTIFASSWQLLLIPRFMNATDMSPICINGCKDCMSPLSNYYLCHIGWKESIDSVLLLPNKRWSVTDGVVPG